MTRTPPPVTPASTPPSHRLWLDYTNKSARIIDSATGKVIAAYSGLPRRDAAVRRVAADGWHLSPGGQWTYTDPPDGREHPIHHHTREPHMNATLSLLFEAVNRDTEDIALRELARRAGLLWFCQPCFWDSPGGTACEHCGTPPPEGTPGRPALTVFPVVAIATGTTVAVCDDSTDAAALAGWFNQSADDGEAEVLGVGAPIPHNPVPEENVLDHLEQAVRGAA